MSRLLNFTSLPATIWLNRIWLFLTGYRARVSGWCVGRAIGHDTQRVSSFGKVYLVCRVASRRG